VLMQSCAAKGLAVLGICLGAQIMARGLGAQNLLGTAPEFGWCPVTRTTEAAADQVLQHLPAEFPIFQWHSDTFTLPPGALHLASSKTARVQCFKTGRAGYGMQFHFEANRAMVADWTKEFGPLIETVHPGWHAQLPDLARGVGVEADAHGLALARAWVALI
jgi:GMP synthase (glutamine-hydrolysing)